MKWMRLCAAALALAGTLAAAAPGMAQDKTEITISRQPGILYMAAHVMEKQKLVEKQAAALGPPSPAAAPRPTLCWPAASTSSTPASATCCCCGTAPAAE